MSGARRAAIYLRVSSDEQTLENQRPDVEQIIHARGLELIATYEEHVSAAKPRAEFSRMMRDAHRGAFATLVIWALDRFGRSLAGNVQAVLELDRCGVQVVSVREPWLDASGPVRPLLIAIFSWVAEQERARLSERTRAGMDRARKSGVHIGRPVARVDERQVLELRAAKVSVDVIAARLAVSRSTIKRVLARSKRGAVKTPS